SINSVNSAMSVQSPDTEPPVATFMKQRRMTVPKRGFTMNIDKATRTRNPAAKDILVCRQREAAGLQQTQNKRKLAAALALATLAAPATAARADDLAAEIRELKEK